MWMRNEAATLFLFSFLSLLSLPGCGKLKLPSITIPNAGVGGGNSTENLLVSCTAALPDGSNGNIQSGVAAAITLTAQGGVSPYQVVGASGSFASQTTVSRTYSNTTHSNLVVNDAVAIKDSLGLTANCPITVTVLPPAPTPSDLSCAIDATDDSPAIDEVVFLYLKASGGSSPYTFSNLGFDAGATSVIGLSKLWDGRATGAAYYASPGAKTVSVTVTDSTGTQVACTTVLNVHGNPSAQISASPSATVASTAAITLTATATGFADTPKYSFSTSEPGVTITPTSSANSVVVTSNEVTAHHVFDVLVSVKDTSGNTASASAHLTFTPAVALTCHLTHFLDGPFTTGRKIAFQVNADSGEVLDIVQFSPGSGGSISSAQGQAVQATYSTAGTKMVTASARSASSGQLCNGGAPLEDTLVIGLPLACSLLINPNPSWAGYEVTATVAVPAGAGSGAAHLVSVQASPGGSLIELATEDSLNEAIAFPAAGIFPVMATVEDASGATATCTSTQIVVTRPN